MGVSGQNTPEPAQMLSEFAGKRPLLPGFGILDGPGDNRERHLGGWKPPDRVREGVYGRANPIKGD